MSLTRGRDRECFHCGTGIPKGQRASLPFLTCNSPLEIEKVDVHKQCCYHVCRLKWCRCCGLATIRGKQYKLCKKLFLCPWCMEHQHIPRAKLFAELYVRLGAWHDATNRALLPVPESEDENEERTE